MPDFRSLLQSQQTMLLDGATGTQLDKRGLMGRPDSNLVHPDAVLQIHKDYVQAGCQALITNTLTLNRIAVETHGEDLDVGQINRAGAELARQAAEPSISVLGNMSSTGQLLEPYGIHTEDQFLDTFREQARILADAGVDGFIVETILDLREGLCALQTCKEVSDLPVIVSMVFSTETKGGRTIMGNSAEECAAKLEEGGVDAVGANCGDLDPLQMAEVVAMLQAATSLPILAEPNAGKPKLLDGRTVFDMEPEPFAAGIAECLQAGARLVGGCCGTSPEHIAAVRAVLDGS
ncbi:MAG: homocysteine S-methyltransferase family protein [Candidatus Latescibacteria bacterium]|nr:homocysteine S-methyltransferase family protein [Candidatus Latescibacterota bacterium]